MSDKPKSNNVDWVGTFVYALFGLAVLAALAIIAGTFLLSFGG